MKAAEVFASIHRRFKGSLGYLRTWVLLFVALILLVLAYYVQSDRYTPFTTDAYVQAYVIQVAAQVEGQVVRVAVHENEAVQQGQLLFEIDPRPFQHRVHQLEAKLALVTHQIAQLDSELAAARAAAEHAQAEHVYATEVYNQENEIFKQESTTRRRYLDAIKGQTATRASLERARALIKQKEQALSAMLGKDHALVAEVKAELATARLDLDWCQVRAPVDGVVTNLQLQPGAYVHVGEAVLTCIDGQRRWVVANYRENCLENIAPGQAVQLSFNTYPGRLWNGTVETVGWGVDQGQGVPSGKLPEVRTLQPWVKPAQRFQVRITPEVDRPLRVGATATATVFTRESYWLSPLADAWQQIVAYFDYLY